MVEADQDSFLRHVAGVCGHVNAQHAQLVRLTETMLSEGVRAEHGCRTPGHWLAWQTGVSSSTARKMLIVAERARSHPCLLAAFDAVYFNPPPATHADRN